jgi:hypothetical protein
VNASLSCLFVEAPMGSRRLPAIGFGFAIGLLLVLGVLRPSSAQDLVTPAHLSSAEGSVTLERESQSESPAPGLVLLAGDRIRTGAGRAEILFPDGSALAVDEQTSVDILDTSLLRLVEGRVLLTVAGAGDPRSAARFQIDTRASSVRTQGPGEYSVMVSAYSSGAETELAVVRGSAELATDRDSVRLRSGESATTREGFPPSLPVPFNSARADDFVRWADAKRAERMGHSASTQYLPQDLRMYGGTLDRHGAWQYEAAYGYVWYPSVAAAWRPYYKGYWSALPKYGWTWIGLDVWAWPTHYYGRWGHAGSRWFWVPDRRWAPAWVSWASAPGYIGWCPLGFDNRPVFSLAVNVGSPWTGWVAMPRTRFGVHGSYVHRDAVPAPHRFFGNDTPFIQQAGAPVAVPRGRSAAFEGAAGDTDGIRTRRPGTQNVTGYSSTGRAVRNPGALTPPEAGPTVPPRRELTVPPRREMTVPPRQEPSVPPRREMTVPQRQPTAVKRQAPDRDPSTAPVDPRPEYRRGARGSSDDRPPTDVGRRPPPEVSPGLRPMPTEPQERTRTGSVRAWGDRSAPDSARGTRTAVPRSAPQRSPSEAGSAPPQQTPSARGGSAGSGGRQAPTATGSTGRAVRR